LTYHAVGTPALGDHSGLFSITPARFRSHIETLVATPRCTPVALQPLNLPSSAATVTVTFDDGYRDNLYAAAPVLAQYGVPFSVFVAASYVKNRRPGFLSPAELLELERFPGASIGSHGMEHVRLTDCAPHELESELVDSKHYLEDLLGKPVDSLTYPFGAVDGRVREAAARAGYRTALSTRFDINRPGRDPLTLCRCDISRDDTTRVLRQKLHGDWDWFRWRSRDPMKMDGRHKSQ